MPDYRQMVDTYGLSEDSMRGSEQHIVPQLVGADGNKGFDGRQMTREPLSYHEERALILTGKLEAGHNVQTTGEAPTPETLQLRNNVVNLPRTGLSNPHDYAPESGALEMGDRDIKFDAAQGNTRPVNPFTNLPPGDTDANANVTEHRETFANQNGQNNGI